MQTHVLLRAPRRFSHPAWIPKQNLTRSLEGVLSSFLKDAYDAKSRPDPKRKHPRAGVNTEGVWIGCKRSPPDLRFELPTTRNTDGDEVAEEDEMIWWAWDGKIVGFSDW